MTAVPAPDPAKTRQRLRRLEPDFGMSRYLHPHGYLIIREKRTWSERTGRVNGQADWAPPMYWWRVHHHAAKRRSMFDNPKFGPGLLLRESETHPSRDFDTLGEARAWCDEHPREGWAA